jgi:hypothetical protein
MSSYPNARLLIEESLSASAEIVTDVGLVALTAKDHADLAALVSGCASPDETLGFYHSVVGTNGKFPAAWERLILQGQIASLPERMDLKERLAVVEAQLGNGPEVSVAEGANPVTPSPPHAMVQTSKGPVALDRAGHDTLLRLMAAQLGYPQAQAFYTALADRGVAFPPEWELLVVREAVKAYPDRDDLLLRMIDLEQALGVSVKATRTALHMAFHRAWARFSQTELVQGTEDERRMRRGVAFDDACSLLSSPVFADQPLARRVGIIVAIHNTLMSVPSPDMPVVAELGMKRFREMLVDPALSEPQACMVFDCLHSLYFAGISDTQELRRFDTLVPSFEAWLEARHGRHERPAASSPGDQLTIAYLLHTGHSYRGNAVTPLVISLAEMHAARPNRRVLVYLVQYVVPDFVTSLEERGIEVRAFDQGQRYDRLDEIAAALHADGVDVVITEQNRAIAVTLFVRRVAARQMWFDTGFPFWRLRALDWTISPVMPATGPAPQRTSPILLRQTADTLRSAPVDPEAVSAVRAQFPRDAFVLGVFVRLVKLDESYLSFLRRLLDANPRFRIVIAGPGDAGMVLDWVNQPDMAGRAKLVEGNVDLNVYGPAIDVMCDTFPFIGGLACREVAAHGTPVVAKLGTNWDAVLKADRNPELLAETESEYIDLVVRLATDPTFLARQRAVALDKAAEYSEPNQAVDDVEAAIAEAFA